MKQSRLVLAAVLVAALGTSAVLAYACSDKSKGASATTASLDKAACGTSAAKTAAVTAAMGSCASKGASATTAANECPYTGEACPHGGTSGTAAVTASAGASCGTAKTAAVTASAGASCGTAKTTAVTASAGGSCGTQKASATTAAKTASAGDACCAGTGAAKTAAVTASKEAASSCGFGAAGVVTAIAKPGQVDAVAAGASCGSHDSAAKGTMAHGGCDACSDMANCEGELRDAEASMQVVPLKNGVMYVYTASGVSKVQAVQAAMTRRADRMNAMLAAGDKATLCPECKTMRGAIASGKLHREQVNIEGGCLTLMTSTDAAMVNKLHAMAGLKNGQRAKS
jgi:hypothetical protein